MMRTSVLVAEDDVITRWDLREILEAHGYQVIESGDGNEAVRLARLHRPDVLLLDVKMPGLDGLEVAERLAEEALPIILLTAYSQPPLIGRAKDLGVQAFLVKPAPEAEVVAAVEIALTNGRRLAELSRRLERTFKSLADRKEVEQAKEQLAVHLARRPHEAYGLMREASMQLRIPIGEVARRYLSGNLNLDPSPTEPAFTHRTVKRRERFDGEPGKPTPK